MCARGHTQGPRFTQHSRFFLDLHLLADVPFNWGALERKEQERARENVQQLPAGLPMYIVICVHSYIYIRVCSYSYIYVYSYRIVIFLYITYTYMCYV